MAHWFGDARRGRIGAYFVNRPTLAAYWQLNGNSSDNSANGNNGTDTTVVYGGIRPGRFGRAPYFTANSSKIVTSNTTLIGGTSDFTILMWIYYVDPSTNAFLLTRRDSFPPDWEFFGIGDGTGKVNFLIGSTQIWGSGSEPNISINRWTIVALKRESNTWKLFADGVMVSTASNSTSITTGHALRIGNIGDANLGVVGSSMEEIAIFNEAIPDAVISQYSAWAIKRHPGRLINRLKTLVAFTKTMTDSIMNGASRSATVSRLAAYTRKPSDSIMNSASRLATLSKGLARSISTSIMNA